MSDYDLVCGGCEVEERTKEALAQCECEAETLTIENERLRSAYLRAILDLTHLYESLGREGWEEGMTESEAVARAHATLCEYYGDPYPREDRELPPEYLRQPGGAE